MSVSSASQQTGPAPIVGAVPPVTNTFAVVGMSLGIFSLLMSCCCYGIPFNVLGLIFSILGLNQIKKSNPPQKGREMAIAGLILSIISLLVGVLLLILGAAASLPQVLEQLKNKF